MSLRKLIVLVIFFWGSAHSKQPGGMKLQMKDGNVFFDDGNGDLPLEVMEKGPDLSCLQDSSIPSNSSSPSLLNTLNLLDKTIGDLGNNWDKKKAFSELDVTNQRERIYELRKLLGECNLVETSRGDESDIKSGSGNKVKDPENHKTQTKNKQESKISDTDLQKIREVLDKEYGKSILLIPKHDLESFINFVKEYSLNDLLKNTDSAEFRNTDDRVRLRNPPSASNGPANLNRLLSTRPQTKIENHDVSEENRQQVMHQVARLLDEISPPQEPAIQEPPKLNSLSAFGNSNGQSSFSSGTNQNPMKNSPRQEPVSLELVRDLLDNLSEGKTQLKQSLLRWFEKNSESDTSRQRHFNVRRSLKKTSTTSSPLKKDKKNRKSQQKDKAVFQRISRCDYPIFLKHRLKPMEQAIFDYDSTSDDNQQRDKRDFKTAHFNFESNRELKQNDPAFIYQAREEEARIPGKRCTRADIIR